jgi:L-asparaginase/Glu-tRNA(Gln) amidotransferase subunit D
LIGQLFINYFSDYDGKANIVNSIKQLMNPECSIYAPGITINFSGKIHSPVYIQKEHSFAVDPFSSGRLGVIGRENELFINTILIEILIRD